MGSILASLLSSASGPVLQFLVTNLAGSIYPKIVAEGESLLTHLEGESPLVKDAASLIADVLTNSPATASMLTGTTTDIATVVAKLIGGEIGKLSAADASVSGTTVASSSSSASASPTVTGEASAIGSAVGEAVAAQTGGILATIEGLFSKHTATMAAAAGTAAAEAVKPAA